MTPTIAAVIDKILEDEGGIADVGDGKGVTRFGQTPRWLADNDLPIPHTSEDAKHNYAVWMQRFRLSDLCERDAWSGWIVTDTAVHFGERTAIRMLQRALIVSVDGVIGPETLQRFHAVAGTRVFRLKFLAQKIRAYGDLLASDTVDRRQWARGWLNRYAEQVESLP